MVISSMDGKERIPISCESAKGASPPVPKGRRDKKRMGCESTLRFMSAEGWWEA